MTKGNANSIFKVGMLVKTIAVDNFYPDEMPIGSVWEVISVQKDFSSETLTVKRAGLNHPYFTPYSRKFEPLDGHVPMVEPDMDLEEIHKAQELVNGG